MRGFVAGTTGKSFEQIAYEMRTGKTWDRGRIGVEEQRARGAGDIQDYGARQKQYGARPFTGQEGASQATPAQHTSVPEPVQLPDATPGLGVINRQIPEVTSEPVTQEVTPARRPVAELAENLNPAVQQYVPPAFQEQVTPSGRVLYR